MNILIPMAGAGQRFRDAGYKLSKPEIPVTSRHSRKSVPMIVAATQDLLYASPQREMSSFNLIYIDRTFHRDSGLEEMIRSYIPNARFITIDYLTEGQAATCLLAKDQLKMDAPLLIGGCDYGMLFDQGSFNDLTQTSEVIVFSFRNNPNVLASPDGYGWIMVDKNNKVTKMSVKKHISNSPMNDHAVTATFWFKRTSDFVRSAERMIKRNDRINGEFYLDQVIQHCIDLELKVKVFEIDKYFCWGTPVAYEEYENSISYWINFAKREGLLNA